MPVRPSAACAAALLLCAAEAGAGAWTRPPGSAFLATGTSYYESGGDFPYEEATGSAYGEYGLTPGVTLGGSVEYKEPLGENAPLGQELTVSGFGRFRLDVGEVGDPTAVQLGVELPVDEALGEGAARRPDAPALELRMLYGRGFATPLGAGFVDAQGAFRANLDDAADEVRIDLTAGVRPHPRWLGLVQSFNTIGLRNPSSNGDREGEDYDVHKLAPSLGFVLPGGVTMLVGYEREIAGRNLEALGERWRLAFWREF